jgi:hypothetical protein
LLARGQEVEMISHHLGGSFCEVTQLAMGHAVARTPPSSVVSIRHALIVGNRWRFLQ